jgi:type IV pilus assembly protein PilP
MVSALPAFVAVATISSEAFAQAHPPVSAPPRPGQTGSGVSGSSGSELDANSRSTMFSGLMDPFDYDLRGRRDPFARAIPDIPVSPGAIRGPLLPLQKFDIKDLRLTGIIWDVRRPRALITDPSGQTHIVTPNTKLGPRNGYVAVIREGEIVIVETVEQGGRLVSTAQVVKIAK